MEHACASRHGDAPAAGIAASRRSRRYPKRLRLCMRGLRWPAASCLAGPALQPQMLAAWRRPSRGAPTGPRCPGRMCSGRPYEAADTCCGRARAQRPSGEHGLRGVARAFSCAGERGLDSRLGVAFLRSSSFVSVRVWSCFCGCMHKGMPLNSSIADRISFFFEKQPRRVTAASS